MTMTTTTQTQTVTITSRPPPPSHQATTSATRPVPKVTAAVSRESPIHHAIAGSIAAALAMSLFYPLDQLRTFQQVDDEYLKASQTCDDPLIPGHCSYLSQFKKLMDRHGAGVLYRGLVPVITSMGVSNFVYFYVYNALKTSLAIYKKKTGKDISSVGMLAMSTIAGVINVLLTTPLWVAATRAKLSHTPLSTTSSSTSQPLASSQSLSIFTAMAKIQQEEGWGALWSGTLPSLLLVCNPVIQFFVYDHLKNWRLAINAASSTTTGTALKGGNLRRQLSSHEAFLYGAISKALATIVSYPLQVAQSRLRLQEERGLHQDVACYQGTLECLYELWRLKGLSGWYQGLEAKLLQTVLTSGFMFLCYERIYGVTKKVADLFL